uniref:EMI domain-containing protein n=1 Tax=Eptatretus burgeri TaxID=7764 RepID=A0A8C4NNZ7_EPTBU
MNEYIYFNLLFCAVQDPNWEYTSHDVQPRLLLVFLPVPIRNWCTYVNTRTISCAVINSTEMRVRPSRRSCPWKHSKCSHFTTYHTYMKPIYRIGYKTVTELRWKCCPGFTSTNCQVTRPTGWAKGQGKICGDEERCYKTMKRIKCKQNKFAEMHDNKCAPQMLEVKTVLRAKSEVLHNLQDTVRSQAEQIRRLTEATRPSAVLPVPSTVLLDTLLVDRLAELKGASYPFSTMQTFECDATHVFRTQAHQEAAVLRKHLNDSVSSILTDLGNLRSEVEGHSLHPLPGSHLGGVDLSFQGNASLTSHHCCRTAFAQIADCERRISALEGRLVGSGPAAGTGAALHPSLPDGLARPSDLDSRIRALERLCDPGPCNSGDVWLRHFNELSDRVHQNFRLISHLNKSMKVDGPTGKGVEALQGELTLLRLSFNTVNGSIRGLRDAVRALGGELTQQEVAEEGKKLQYAGRYGRTGRAVYEMTTTLHQKWRTCHRDNKVRLPTVDQECEWLFELNRTNSSHYLWAALKRLNTTIGHQQHQLASLKVMQDKLAERLTTSTSQTGRKPLEKRG